MYPDKKNNNFNILNRPKSSARTWYGRLQSNCYELRLIEFYFLN